MLKKWSALVGAVGLLGLVLGGISSAGTSSDITSPQTIEVRAFTTQFQSLDLGARGHSQGDEVVFHDVLKDQEGQKLGHDGGTCTATFASPNAQFQCVVTFVLSGGQITVQGLTTLGGVSPGGHFVVGVTGGTGAYRNVRGVAAIQTVDQVESDITFHLIP